MEVESKWYILGLNANKPDIIPFVQDFISKTGRIEYLLPIYRAFKKYNLEGAQKAFESNKYEFIINLENIIIKLQLN